MFIYFIYSSLQVLHFFLLCLLPLIEDFLSDSYPPLDSLCKQPETGLTDVPGSEDAFRTN